MFQIFKNKRREDVQRFKAALLFSLSAGFVLLMLPDHQLTVIVTAFAGSMVIGITVAVLRAMRDEEVE